MTVRLSRAEAQRLGMAVPTQPPKFGNTRATWRGWSFDSLVERAYAEKLERGRLQGTVLAWVHHPIFPLSDGTGRDAVRIELDFLVVWSPRRAELNGAAQAVAVDVKGAITDGWRVKARLFRQRYPHIPLFIEARGQLQEWTS